MSRRERDERLPIEPGLDWAQPGPEHPRAPNRAGPSRRRAQPSVLAAIAGGGALGSLARYGVAQAVHVAPGSYPWATMWTNVSGSFVLGLVLALVLERFPPGRYLRPFVATGFLGAYTTYSTFAVETVLLVHGGHPVVALTYAATSLVGGCLSAWAGVWAARVVPLPGRGGGRP